MNSRSLLNADQVAKLLGYRARSSVWRLTQEGLFPLPIQISRGIKRWRREDVDAYIKSLKESVEERKAPVPSDRKGTPLIVFLKGIIADLEMGEAQAINWTVERSHSAKGGPMITLLLELASEPKRFA